MVSHTSTIIVSSPVPPRLPSPALGPLPSLAGQTKSKARLDRLFSLGQKRFGPETPAAAKADDPVDRDEFAELYCRVLQTATRGNAIRNRDMRAELAAVREENRRLRESLLAAAEEQGGIQEAAKQSAQLRKCAADVLSDADTTAAAAARRTA